MECLRITLTENSYTRQMEATFADCGRDQLVRPSALLRLAADMAGHDYNARGLTHEKLLELRQVFLLSRVSLRVHRRPRAWEVLDVTTWEDGARGAHLRRVYEAADRRGAVCVSIKSDWILVDPATRRIMRPSAFTAKPLGRCPKEIDCPEPGRIALPGEDAAELGRRRVERSDLDGNGHLYSARYGDIVWDFLPPETHGLPLAEFSINYSREATLGQTLTLRGCRDGLSYRMAGLGPAGPCFAAECVFQEGEDGRAAAARAAE